MEATGTFEVAIRPLAGYAEGVGRMSLDKTFSGDLVATSQGEMLTAMTAVDGSAGYVAVERVEGVLHGRGGTFLLQHFGMMQGGSNRLMLEVVADSATGELTGLSGSMTIDIDTDGTHFYTLTYTLA